MDKIQFEFICNDCSHESSNVNSIELIIQKYLVLRDVRQTFQMKLLTFTFTSYTFRAHYILILKITLIWYDTIWMDLIIRVLNN